MNRYRFFKGFNFLWYQTFWFTAVLGGWALQPLLGLLLLLHLWLVADWLGELRLIALVSLLGGTVDSALALAGFFEFNDTRAIGWPLPIPLWHLAIWAGFAGTLRHSMAFMVARPYLMTLAAGVFAPLTYLAAGRLDAVAFGYGALPTAITVGLAWFALVPLMVAMSQRGEDASIPRSKRRPHELSAAQGDCS